MDDLYNKETIIIEDLFKEYDYKFKKIIKPIINHPEFQKMRYHLHHDNISTYLHVLHVSWIAYNDAKKKKLDYKSAAIAGLLHDFYLYDWHITEQEKKGVFNMHLFSHPVIANNNAHKYFDKYMNKKIENSILAHSWHMYIFKKLFKPISFKLTKHIPKYKESWIVSFADIKASMYSAKSPKMIASSLGMHKHVDALNFKLVNSTIFLTVIGIFR